MFSEKFLIFSGISSIRTDLIKRGKYGPNTDIFMNYRLNTELFDEKFTQMSQKVWIRVVLLNRINKDTLYRIAFIRYSIG